MKNHSKKTLVAFAVPHETHLVSLRSLKELGDFCIPATSIMF